MQREKGAVPNWAVTLFFVSFVVIAVAGLIYGMAYGMARDSKVRSHIQQAIDDYGIPAVIDFDFTGYSLDFKAEDVKLEKFIQRKHPSIEEKYLKRGILIRLVDPIIVKKPPREPLLLSFFIEYSSERDIDARINALSSSAKGYRVNLGRMRKCLEIDWTEATIPALGIKDY